MQIDKEEFINVQTYIAKDRKIDRWMDRQIDRQMDGQIDRWMDG